MMCYGDARMQRVAAIDALRGFVMVLMALDHARDMLMTPHAGGLDFSQAGLALFFTRWVTHLCAPTFVFLAGVSASGYAARHGAGAALTRYLVSRGLWLVVAELTVISLGWNLNLSARTFIGMQVIWAIGWSMVALSVLAWLPRPVIGAIGGLMVLGHNLLDGIQPPVAQASAAWVVLHLQGPLRIGETIVGFIAYPLVPWVGVMALGYVAGPFLLRGNARRVSRTAWVGALLVASFVVLRALHAYGEPSDWTVGPTWQSTLVSFLNVTKYPPSLHFLLVTLGIAAIVLAVFEGRRGPAMAALTTVGRVPFFYYVVHLYVIHALAVIVGVAQGFPASAIAVMFFFYPKTFGVGLGMTYVAWVAVVAALYPACRWFAGVKARRTDWWLAYL